MEIWHMVFMSFIVVIAISSQVIHQRVSVMLAMVPVTFWPDLKSLGPSLCDIWLMLCDVEKYQCVRHDECMNN